MASNDEVKITISAEDKASGIFAKVSNSMGKMGDIAMSTAKVVGGGLVAAFGAATAFGVASLNDFMDAEKQMTIANTAVNNTLQSMSEQGLKKLHVGMKDGLEDFEVMQIKMEEVGKAAVKLGFDDEAASVAFSKLFAVSQDVTQAQADLKLAMDLAAFSGRDLESAAQAVTMVHAGGTRVLKEFGIEVKDGTTAMDALALVNDRVAGAAENMANTTGGQLKVLSIEWGNLKETVGGALATAITPFIKQLADWASDPAVQKKITEIATGIGNMAAVIFQATVAIFNFFQMIANSQVVQITLEAIAYLWKNMADTINLFLLPAWQYFYQQLEPQLPYIKTFFEVIASIIGMVLMAAVIGVTAAITGLVAAIAIVTSAITGLIGIWTEMANILADKVNKGLQTLDAWLTGINDKITSFIGKINDAIDALKRMATQTASATGGFFTNIGNTLTGKKAAGGPVASSGSYLVGENGPELFSPGRAGTIFPNGGGSGASINIYVTGNSIMNEDMVTTIMDTAMNKLKMQLRI